MQFRCPADDQVGRPVRDPHEALQGMDHAGLLDLRASATQFLALIEMDQPA